MAHPGTAAESISTSLFPELNKDGFRCTIDGLSDVEMNNPLIDRILGTLYGNALADCLGLKTEFLTKKEIPQYYGTGTIDFLGPALTKHSQRWDLYDWTDDFDLVVVIMETMLEAHRKQEQERKHALLTSGGS